MQPLRKKKTSQDNLYQTLDRKAVEAPFYAGYRVLSCWNIPPHSLYVTAERKAVLDTSLTCEGTSLPTF